MKKNSFTIVELLAVIVILGILLAVAIPTIQNIVENSKQHAYEVAVDEIIKGAKRYMVDNSGSVQYLEQSGLGFIKLSDLIAAGEFSGTITDPRTGNPFDSNAVIKVIETSYGEYSYQFYDTPVIAGYNTIKGVNKPELASGMIAVTWNGSNWIKEATPETDTSWYNYDTTNKQWANAVTVTPATRSTYQAAADGTVVNMADIISMWVWIPRFIYRISSGWHTNTTGTIDIQFSIGTDDTRSGTVTLDTSTGASASNNKWTNHPAFTFGSTQLNGFWMTKFEASAPTTSACYTTISLANCNVTNLLPQFLPSVVSWQCIYVGNAFTSVRNMETSDTYGWGTSGNGIDTHLTKNVEWGAVAYLSKSSYGQGANEVWINPTNNGITGCSGASATSATTIGCLYIYNTANGQNASTTGNIYGIYDMSGGSRDYVSVYLNNGHSALNNNGSSIVSANSKYKDVYAVGGTDTQANNYGLAINQKGDALYEISSNVSGIYSWFSDSSYMPATSTPWLVRGGVYTSGSDAGVFNFFSSSGAGTTNYGFHSVLLVNTGL